jgi:hypothetical protein
MKARASNRPGPHAQTDDTAQVMLEGYRRDLVTAVTNQGLHAARLGDPDAFEGAVEAINAALAKYGIITADDVVWPNRGNELGAAFRHMTRSGQIKCVGYEPSKRLKAHGRLLRAWRRT